MFKIEQGAGQVIAQDTQNSIEALDNAVMATARLCTSIVEVSKASRLPVSVPQSALNFAGESLVKLISSRSDVGSATKRMLAIQHGSSLKTTSFGCPEGFPEPSAIANPAEVPHPA